MGYNQEVYAAAAEELARRRAKAEADAEALRREMTAKNPKIAALEAEMRASASAITQAVIRGGDVEAVVAEMRLRNEAAQRELAALLRAEGAAADNFLPQYTCPHCEDTGYIGSSMCDCFRRLLAGGAANRLARMSGMELTSLDTMDLSYYKDRGKMKNVIDFCRAYGEDFSPQSDSLLLFGPTGVGKTHVALALAGMAARKGFTVVYGPAQQLFGQMEREHFGREEGDTGELLTSADLLVIDDLGTELGTAFYQVAMYNVINTRLLSRRPTIISTNLMPKDLQARYGVQITSRILGTYMPLPFQGEDIRQQQLERRLRRFE